MTEKRIFLARSICLVCSYTREVDSCGSDLKE